MLPGTIGRLKRSFLGSALLVLLLGLFAVVSAAPPGNVTLVYFRGESLGDAARLEWQTATELDTAAFKIERANDAGGPFTYVTEIGLVPAQGDAAAGHTYEVTDTSAETGATYWYRLIEVELDNSERRLQTIEVAILTTPTPAPVGGGPADATETPPPSSTPAASGTPAATVEQTPGTATDTPSASSTTLAQGGATNTPRATATPAPADEETDQGVAATFVTPTRFSNNGGRGAGSGGATAVAQSTLPSEEYPGPSPTASSAEGYPFDAQQLGPTQPPSSAGNTGAGTLSTVPPALGSGASAGERTVGSGSDGNVAEAAQSNGGSTVGRILLWIGFVFALLIFAAGAFFAIVLSTRRPPQKPPEA